MNKLFFLIVFCCLFSDTYGACNINDFNFKTMGGDNIKVIASRCQSFIGGGESNCITGSNTAIIVGGANNFARADGALVVGGGSNQAVSFRSAIVSGKNNYACEIYSAIINGCHNLTNTGSTYGLIGNGVCNSMSASYAFIGNGCCNTVSGAYSAILGGSGNTDSGYQYAGIYGQNITAVAANTFHVECLNANSLPSVPVGTTIAPALPPGSFYFMNCVVGSVCPLFVA